MASQGVEIEKKYDVGEDAVVPALAGLPGVDRVGEPHVTSLEAVYFDTGDHALAARRITLRRRTGGTDAGWHLKLPPGNSAGAVSDAGAAPGAGDASETGDVSEPQQRRELHEPLGQPAVVPERLLAHLHAYLRGAELAPVIRLETQRTTYPLYAETGVHLADLADDRVEAEAPGSGPGPEQGGRKQQWREWELELVHGDEDLFPAAAGLLAEAGASPSRYPSKLARALGGGQETGPESGTPAAEAPATQELGKKSPASAVVTAYLAAQIGELLAYDPGVRLEEPDAVHQMRSAARRARSVLASYRRLFSAVAVRRLRDELKWLGGVLGVPRDAEVLMDRLRGHVEELDLDEASPVVLESLERDLGARYDSGYRKAQKVLLSERYFRLLDDLEAFRDQPPVRPQGGASARKAGAEAVEKAARRLRRSHKAAKNSRKGARHEMALHQVRKDAKRLRHVGESVEPVYGKRAARIANAARKQQQILGDFHDSVLARDLVGRLGAAPGLPEPVASAFVTLRTRQVQLVADAESKYLKARKKSRKVLSRRVI
jgi:CHAD domain-containing protein